MLVSVKRQGRNSQIRRRSKDDFALWLLSEPWPQDDRSFFDFVWEFRSDPDCPRRADLTLGQFVRYVVTADYPDNLLQAGVRAFLAYEDAGRMSHD